MSIPYVGIYRFFIDFTIEKMNCTVRLTVTSNCNLTQTLDGLSRSRSQNGDHQTIIFY